MLGEGGEDVREWFGTAAVEVTGHGISHQFLCPKKHSQSRNILLDRLGRLYRQLGIRRPDLVNHYDDGISYEDESFTVIVN